MRSERMDNKAHFHFHTSCTAYHFRYNVETLSYHTMYMLGLCSFRPSRMPGTISGTEREEKRERERERTGAKERVVQFEFAIMPFHLISSGWFGFFCVRIMFSIVIILAGTGQNTHAIYWKLHGGGLCAIGLQDVIKRWMWLIALYWIVIDVCWRMAWL